MSLHEFKASLVYLVSSRTAQYTQRNPVSKNYKQTNVHFEGGAFETGFLCSFGACPGIHSVEQAGLELTEIHLPASVSQVLGLKACATTTRL